MRLVDAHGSSKPRGRFRSCPCAALKILPRSRRTLSSCSCQFTASQPRASSSGPFTCIGVQLALRFRRVRCFVVKGSPATSQPAFAAGHQARYPAGYTKTTGGGPAMWLRFPAAFRLPAFASWASCSRQGIRLSLRSAYRGIQVPRTLTGFPRSARVRYAPGRVPSLPRRQRCSHGHR